jgi:hypothetical protein
LPLILRDSSGTGALTPTPTTTPTPPGGRCYEAITNGGFERIGGSWKMNGAVPGGYTTAAKHSGNQAARLGILPGQVNIPSWSTTYQEFTVPLNTTSATLRFWWYRGSEQAWTRPESSLPSLQGTPLDLAAANPAPARSYAEVQEVALLDASCYNLEVYLERSLTTDSGWEERVYDVSAYRGRTMVVFFNAYNDGYGGRTWMYVDDVSVRICWP